MTPEKRNEAASTAPLQETDTYTELDKSSIADGRAKSFELFPRAVTDAKRMGELTFYDFGVLCYFIGDINWQTRVWKGSLGSLREHLEWPHSDDYLRKTLKKLRAERWIEYVIRSGERHYEISLGQRMHEALYGTNLRQSSDSEAPSSLTFPQTDEVAELASIPHKNGDAGVSKAQTRYSPYTDTYTDTDTDTDIDKDTVAVEALSGEGEVISPSQSRKYRPEGGWSE